MFIFAMNIYMVLWEILKIAPLTIPFEAALLLSYIGDFLIKSNPNYSTRISMYKNH